MRRSGGTAFQAEGRARSMLTEFKKRRRIECGWSGERGEGRLVDVGRELGWNRSGLRGDERAVQTGRSGEARLWPGNTHRAMEFDQHIREHRNLWRETVGIKVSHVDRGLPRRVLDAGLGS